MDSALLASRRRIAWRVDTTAVLLFVCVQVLNLADAALTRIAIRSGAAYEANPVVTAIGLDGKLLLVAVVTAAVAVLRPKALLVPIGVLSLVVLWSTAGLLLLT